MAKKRIGEVLLERRAITPAQLEAGLLAQKRTRQRLGLTLIEQGIISESQLATVLAESLELSPVDLRVATIDWSAVHLLRPRFCETHELFAYAVEGKGTAQRRLIVAMSDPLNQPAMEEIEFTTGIKVTPRVGTYTQIREAILKFYHKANGSTVLPGAPEDDEPAVVMGEEISSVPVLLPDVDLDTILAQRAAQSQKRGSPSAVLFGEDEGVERLERKFWALMRLMAKKGLLTRDEFLREFDES
jgi:hypothetical protein